MKVKETAQLFLIENFKQYSDVYIETGSCHGGSIERALAAGFKRVKSVEVHPPFYNICLERFKNVGKVKLFLGESRHELPVMLEDVSTPAVIFLDAHPAGPNTGGHDDFMEKGAKSEFCQDYILRKELEIILSNNNSHIIIIDDQNEINKENKAYMNMMTKANSAYSFYLYDEQVGENFYKNKLLVCIPNGK